MRKIARKAHRWVFWATAWQAEGVTDPSIRVADHPDRFEVVLLETADQETGRHEAWRARLERVPNEAPRLGEWERMDE